MARLRSTLLAVATLVALAGAPGHATDPTVLVAGREDGALVRVTLTGRAATAVTVIVPPAAGTILSPTQALGSSVAYAARTDDKVDVALVDAGTGTRRAVSRDGRTADLVVSPDGRYRYVARYDRHGTFEALVRTDAAGRHPRTLLSDPPAPPRRLDVWLSGMTISPDGRTVYVARTYINQPSTLLAVDTATGKRHAVALPGVFAIYNVVASPDGRTLAVTFAVDGALSSVGVGLVPVTGGAVDMLPGVSDLYGSAFTRDGSGLLLSVWPYPADYDGLPRISIADVRTHAIVPIAGTEHLFQAVPAG